MFLRQIFLLTIVLLLTLGLLLSLVYGAETLGTREAREKIAQLAGLADFKQKDDVRIKSIGSPIGGQVVVEAQIETAVKFTKVNNDWQITEIRVGDRQWEEIELIKTALNKEKAARTQAELAALQTALAAYRRERGRLVPATNIVELTDALAPSYMARVIRYDAWDQELNYQPLGNGYRLSSAGPDRQAGTADDIVVAGE